MTLKGLLLTLIFVLVASRPSWAEDDFQYWSRFSFTPFSTEQWKFTNFTELRIREDASDTGLWYSSQRLKYMPYEYLEMGIQYTYLENEITLAGSGEDEWKSQHRLELEINPKWKFNNGIRVKNRNRLEFRWIEDKGSDHGRFRQMWHVGFPVKRIEWLDSIFASNEYFVDFNQQTINENRVIPIGIQFKPHKKIGFQVFYMTQSQKGKDWRSNQIIGTKCSLVL